MKLYLDTCCYNRPFDDPLQERVRIEIFAIERIMAQVRRGETLLVAGEVLQIEVARNPDLMRREAITRMLGFARVWAPLSHEVSARARQLATRDIGGFDALHLASALSGGAEVFLTVDDRLVRRAQRAIPRSELRIDLPAAWLESPTRENEQ